MEPFESTEEAEMSGGERGEERQLKKNVLIIERRRGKGGGGRRHQELVRDQQTRAFPNLRNSESDVIQILKVSDSVRRLKNTDSRKIQRDKNT